MSKDIPVVASKQVGGFTLEEARFMGQLADIAYFYDKDFGHKNFQKFKEENGFDEFTHAGNKVIGTEAKIINGKVEQIPIVNPTFTLAIKGTDVYIGCRGTVGTLTGKEWVNNGKILTKPNPYGKGFVHQGFLNDFLGDDPKKTYVSDLIVRIEAYLEQNSLSINNLKFHIAGHSKGGILATILALYLYKKHGVRPENVRVCTFGSPRGFDKDAAKEYIDLFHERTLRFSEHHVDIVTMMPSGFGGYKQVGNNVRLALYNIFKLHGMKTYNELLQQLNEEDFVHNNTPSSFKPISEFVEYYITPYLASATRGAISTYYRLTSNNGTFEAKAHTAQQLTQEEFEKMLKEEFIMMEDTNNEVPFISPQLEAEVKSLINEKESDDTTPAIAWDRESIEKSLVLSSDDLEVNNAPHELAQAGIFPSTLSLSSSTLSGSQTQISEGRVSSIDTSTIISATTSTAIDITSSKTSADSVIRSSDGSTDNLAGSIILTNESGSNEHPDFEYNSDNDIQDDLSQTSEEPLSPRDPQTHQLDTDVTDIDQQEPGKKGSQNISNNIGKPNPIPVNIDKSDIDIAEDNVASSSKSVKKSNKSMIFAVIGVFSGLAISIASLALVLTLTLTMPFTALLYTTMAVGAIITIGSAFAIKHIADSNNVNVANNYNSSTMNTLGRLDREQTPQVTITHNGSEIS